MNPVMPGTQKQPPDNDIRAGAFSKGLAGTRTRACQLCPAGSNQNLGLQVTQHFSLLHSLGCSPLTQTVFRDSSTPYYGPYEGLLVQGKTSQRI